MTDALGSPFEDGPAPDPMIAMLFGAFSGRALLVFFKSTADAAPIWRMRLQSIQRI